MRSWPEDPPCWDFNIGNRTGLASRVAIPIFHRGIHQRERGDPTEARRFCYGELCQSLGDDAAEISITYRRLAELVDEGKEIDRKRWAGPESGVKSTRKMKKTRWKSDSRDTILDDDNNETRFPRQEERAVAREAAGDDDWPRPLQKRG